MRIATGPMRRLLSPVSERRSFSRGCSSRTASIAGVVFRWLGFALSVEIAGLALLWLAFNPAMAFTGAALTRFWVFAGVSRPGRRGGELASPRKNRGSALGVFTAFADLSLGGLTGPVVGLIVAGVGYSPHLSFWRVMAAGALGLTLVLSRTAGLLRGAASSPAAD